MLPDGSFITRGINEPPNAPREDSAADVHPSETLSPDAIPPLPGSIDFDDPSMVQPSMASLPRVPGYQVLGVLGRGGMGMVFRARQIKADRIVALKLPYADATPERRLR